MIREINRNEIPECVNVIRSSFKTVADEFGFTPENAPAFTAFSTTDEKLLYQFDNEKRPMYAYFSDNGEIIGYYSLNLLEDNACELNNLCVLPQHRHSHIGSCLLNDALSRIKDMNCTRADISIVEENQKLRKWYESFGFVHTCTKKFDFFPFTCGYMEKKL